jgi:uncharacterized protein (DUF433 family)
MVYSELMAATLGHEAQETARRLAGCVEKDAGRLRGEPVFGRTRVPVKSLFDHLKAGDSLETFLDDFPGVTREQIRTVLDVARWRLVEEVR